MGFALEIKDSWNIQKPRSITPINGKTDGAEPDYLSRSKRNIGKTNTKSEITSSIEIGSDLCNNWHFQNLHK